VGSTFASPLHGPCTPPLRPATAPGSLSPTQRAVAVLRKFGTDAHVYLPGIGALSGLTAGNYLENTAVNPGVVDQPVGAVLDSVGGIHATQATAANRPILRRGIVNLLTYSGGFSEYWTKGPVLITPGWPDPIGGMSASKLVATATSDIHDVYFDTPAATVLSPYTHAFIVKANGAGFAYMQINEAAVIKASFCAIDLTTGTLGTVQVLAAGLTMTASVASLGNGWYLVAINHTITSTCTGITQYIGTCGSLTDRNYVGDGVSGIFLYRAGFFAGTLTAAQIQAAGGIPLTATVPASSSAGPYSLSFDSTDLLTSTFPTGNESVTIIDSKSTGQVTTPAVNVVGAYNMGPSTTLYGRIIIKGTLTASETALLQKLANSWAGL